MVKVPPPPPGVDLADYLESLPFAPVGPIDIAAGAPPPPQPGVGLAEYLETWAEASMAPTTIPISATPPFAPDFVSVYPPTTPTVDHPQQANAAPAAQPHPHTVEAPELNTPMPFWSSCPTPGQKRPHPPGEDRASARRRQ